MTKRMIILYAGILSASVLTAQEQDSTLNRTIVVENQYNPEVMDAFKVNILPEIEEPAVAKKEIDYATGIRPFDGWTAVPMASFVPDAGQKNARRGYLRAAYGNRNNTDIKGSYLWNITSQDQLGVMASLYGMYGNIPSLGDEEKWKSRFYRTDISLDYKHDFRKVSLSVGGAFASQVFNYMPAYDLTHSQSATARQHYTLGEGYAGIASRGKEMPVNFSLQTGFRTFNRKYPNARIGEGAENIIHTEGFITGEISEEQCISIGMTMDNLIYETAMKDYTLLQINPYYTLRNDDISLRVGAHADLQTANGSGMKFAPDVKLAYTFAESYVVYLQTEGGTRLNDFRQLNETSPYWDQRRQLRTSYTPIDASIGLKASPADGFGFRLYGGYRITKNELFSLPASFGSSTNCLLLQDKAKVAYAGASVSYAYRDWIDFTLKGTYYDWKTESKDDRLLWLKPQFGIDFSARGKVTDNLHITLNYLYEERSESAGRKKADAANSLNIGAEYLLFDRLTAFVRLNNLLDKYYITEAGYPIQGFNVMGGLSFRF